MVEIGVVHNGSTNVPLKRADNDIVIPDASLREIHQDCQQVVKDQIRHGVLADEYGYDRIGYTEHHFQIVAAEYSTNPLMSQMAVANETEDIQICQWANIITWHDPVRFAEQTSLLDIVSDGRLEVGIGRGYQPRENEVLGAEYWGGTIQDQEKNRKVFDEKFEIIKKAWTEDMFSYNGYFHHIPPNYTKWHHDQEKTYLEDDVSEYDVEDMLDWKEGDLYSRNLWTPVLSGGSTLETISVFPQPIQKPHPPIWQPVTSFRSAQWAARNGVNGVSFGDPNVGNVIEKYHETAEEAGWPDHRPEYDGEPFDYGWDSKRQRGVALGVWIFNTDVHDEETFDRWLMGLEHGWDYFGPFGFNQPITGDVEKRITADMFLDTDFAITGDSDEITDQVSTLKESTGVEDLNLLVFFEAGGITGEEADEQLANFAEDVVPYLEEEFPSPESG